MTTVYPRELWKSGIRQGRPSSPRLKLSRIGCQWHRYNTIKLEQNSTPFLAFIHLSTCKSVLSFILRWTKNSPRVALSYPHLMCVSTTFLYKCGVHRTELKRCKDVTCSKIRSQTVRYVNAYCGRSFCTTKEGSFEIPSHQ